MVEDQIVARGVATPDVLASLGAVPRHRFVPAELVTAAYQDSPLPIGLGQTISQPYIVAFMTEQLQVHAGQKVLEIGTGSGYQAAVLAQMGVDVFSMEIVAPLGRAAEARLADLGYGNVRVRIGDGYLGWPEEAPFDGIIVTAAPDHVPGPLLEQLRLGARMVIPVGSRYQELLVITRTQDGYNREQVMPVRFVPMTGQAESRPD